MQNGLNVSAIKIPVPMQQGQRAPPRCFGEKSVREMSQINCRNADQPDHQRSFRLLFSPRFPLLRSIMLKPHQHLTQVTMSLHVLCTPTRSRPGYKMSAKALCELARIDCRWLPSSLRVWSLLK